MAALRATLWAFGIITISSLQRLVILQYYLLRCVSNWQPFLKLKLINATGRSTRGGDAVKALDHDMDVKYKLTPFGILNLDNELLHVIYGNSSKTSDFICDALDGRKR